MTDQPTRADILNAAAAIDLFAADAAIERAFRTEPLSAQERLNEATVQRIREQGTPRQIGTAEFLLDAYALGLLKGGDV